MYRSGEGARSGSRVTRPLLRSAVRALETEPVRDPDDREAPGGHVSRSREKSRPIRLAMTFALAGVLACSDGDGSPPASEPVEATATVEEGSPTPPSVLLVVFDTARADAFSSYGAVEGTTPAVDALAARGTRFARAFAPSPWTVSSHASLFSGLRVDEHGVGLDGVFHLAPDLEMLAELFQAAGYETAAFVENTMVAAEFGFDRGFDRFEAATVPEAVKAQKAGRDPIEAFGVAERVRRWSRTRDRSRPYFVFVNLMDPHDPYLVRDVNRWVPEDASRTEVELAAKRYSIPKALCRNAPTRRDQALLRGLYLGDVAAADAKFDRIVKAMGSDSQADGRITIVTSDHGEHLGEHDLSGHRFSVRTPVLHVPLVIAGVPELATGVVEHAVELRSVYDSLLCWALDEGCPAALGRPEDPDAEPIVSIWSDANIGLPPGPLRDALGIPDDYEPEEISRSACAPDDPVYGELISIIRYPMKVNWASGEVHSLHDLSWDPWERSDLKKVQSDDATRLGGELESFVADRITDRSPGAPSEISPDAARALKALGYVE